MTNIQYPHLVHSNLVGIPTGYFASPAFNLSPMPVHINAVREMNAPLFSTMDRYEKEKVALLFMEHMRVMFGLDAPLEEGEKRRYRASYLRLLRGWFFDSNRPEGAVMKSWVESRFGLRTLFHGEIIDSFSGPVYLRFLRDKMHPRFHNNSIFAQLDLLYEYAQYYLERFGPRRKKFVLYRGFCQGSDETQIIEKREKKIWVIRNNSLASYTTNIERASEFGSTVLKIEAPFAKVFCFPLMLPEKLPVYEHEYILIGGDYLSEIVDFF